MNTLDAAIKKLLVGTKGEINSRLHQVEFDIAIDKTAARGYCHCVKTDNMGNPRVDDLIEFMVEKIVDYAIPKKERDNAQDYMNRTGSSSKLLGLQRKAKELFTDLKKTGEGGEMLLYILVQEFLKLPQLISKMSLKTSGNLHYQGADGVHIGYDETTNSLILYWGESKMYKDMDQALNACFESLKSFLLDPLSYKSMQERDLQLVTSSIKENVNNEELENAIVRYLDKDDDLSNNLEYRGVCFVGFDSDTYPSQPKQKDTAKIAGEIKTQVDRWFASVAQSICKHEYLDKFEIHVFLIPFPSVEAFRETFLKLIK